MEGERGEWGKDSGIKKYELVDTNMHRDVKNSIGNGEAKELICMTHGHELREGIAGADGGTRQREAKGGNWDNCNNKISLKKEKFPLPSNIASVMTTWHHTLLKCLWEPV